MKSIVQKITEMYDAFAALMSHLQSPLLLAIRLYWGYLSVPDDRTNFFHTLSNPEDFYSATPYTYWFAALLILILGPGLFAMDTPSFGDGLHRSAGPSRTQRPNASAARASQEIGHSP